MRRVTCLLLAGLCLAALAAGAAAAKEAAADLTDSPKVADGGKSPSGTDAGAPEREAAGKMSSPAFQRKIRANAEKFEFQAEVNRLMDILIHSLYSNKDIFLRELISNASDALDKIRFLSLTDKSILGEGETALMDIRIWADKASRTLFIRDRGVGMTRDELVKNLGTIAKSGTSAFLEAMQKGGDISLIGQFGVGFYSVYLVADWVEVITRAPGNKQYIWASGADGAFEVSEDGENEDLGRGTLIKIHLKEDAEEYADQAKLQGLVARYSEFINFPIFLQTTSEKDVPVEEEAAEADAKEGEAADKDDAKDDDDSEEDEDGDGDVVDEDDDEPKEEEQKPKTVKQNVTEWQHLNDNKAIWLRKAKDVSAEEYSKFYKAISKDSDGPLSTVHFKAEGDVEFKALLFVPKRAPWDFYDNVQRPRTKGAPASSSAGLKLYVRRVFISDDADELLPRYLSFIKGVVDSDSLPLNVNREMLQAHASLRTIKKKLVRKALDAIKKLADDEAACQDAKDKGGEQEGEQAAPSKEACEAYATFWPQFGRALKLGILEDDNNRGRLAKLLRVRTSKSGDAAVSLSQYVSRMKPGQKSIYYIAGLSLDEVAKSPFAEKLVADGYEVVYMTDVLDEYIMGHLTEFEDAKFVNIAKEDLELTSAEGEDKEAAAKAAKEADKAAREAFKPLTSWWKEALGAKVSSVKLSRRLATTPCVVVVQKWGHSANMLRIMKASAFSDPARAEMMRGQRSLEVNPEHPLIIALRDRVAAAPDDEQAKATAALLYETALLESGFEPDDTKAFAQRMYAMMKGQLGVTADLPGSSSSGGGSGRSDDLDADKEEL